MSLQELCSQHESAFLKMIADYKESDGALFQALFARQDEWDSKTFQEFLKDCQKQKMDWRPKAGKVSVTRYVWLDEDGVICGNGLLRFPLNEEMEKWGGNFWFDVPPAKRGQGYGAWVLNGLLFEAVRAGMARALATCETGNARATRAIEMNRGELDGYFSFTSADGKQTEMRRYWIRFR